MFKFFLYVIAISLIFIAFSLSASNTDPTKPFSVSVAPVAQETNANLILQSIIHSGGIHTAVINGQVIKEGDSYAQYKIEVIDEKSVVLSNKAHKKRIYILKKQGINVSRSPKP